MNFWKNYKEKNGVTPLDLINPNTESSSDEQAQSRLSVCLECPLLVQKINQCSKCGCFMNLKTKMSDAKCPIGKW